MSIILSQMKLLLSCDRSVIMFMYLNQLKKIANIQSCSRLYRLEFCDLDGQDQYSVIDLLINMLVGCRYCRDTRQ